MRFAALLSFGLMPVLAQASDPVSVIEPYDGLGAVALDRGGFVTFYYGRLGGDEPLEGERFELPYLDEEYLFGLLEVDEFLAIGWLEITLIDDRSFDVLLSPSGEFDGFAVDESAPWMFDPYDPDSDDPEVWLEDQVTRLGEARSFNRYLSWRFTVVAAPDEGSSELEWRPAPRDPMPSDGLQSAGIGVGGSAELQSASDEDCTGGSCECSTSSCDCEVCCSSNRNPNCRCSGSICRCTCDKLSEMWLSLDAR